MESSEILGTMPHLTPQPAGPGGPAGSGFWPPLADYSVLQHVSLAIFLAREVMATRFGAFQSSFSYSGMPLLCSETPCCLQNRIQTPLFLALGRHLMLIY